MVHENRLQQMRLALVLDESLRVDSKTTLPKAFDALSLKTSLKIMAMNCCLSVVVKMKTHRNQRCPNLLQSLRHPKKVRPVMSPLLKGQRLDPAMAKRLQELRLQKRRLQKRRLQKRRLKHLSNPSPFT